MTTHLSIRLIWHDSAWNGCICKSPQDNTSCVLHEHVRELRDLMQESDHPGEHISQLENWLPPCARDLGAYNDTSYTITHHDPVKQRKLPPVEERLPAYTCCPAPYRWMREENLRDILDAEDFKLRPSDDADRTNGWVFEPDRQEVLLNNFWGKLEKNPCRWLCQPTLGHQSS